MIETNPNCILITKSIPFNWLRIVSTNTVLYTCIIIRVRVLPPGTILTRFNSDFCKYLLMFFISVVLTFFNQVIIFIFVV